MSGTILHSYANTNETTKPSARCLPPQFIARRSPKCPPMQHAQRSSPARPAERALATHTRRLPKPGSQSWASEPQATLRWTRTRTTSPASTRSINTRHQIMFFYYYLSQISPKDEQLRKFADPATNHTLSKLPAAPLSWMPTKSKQSTKVYVLCLQTYPTEWRVREARSFSNLNAAPTLFLKRQIFVTVAVMSVTRSLIKMSVNIFFFTDFTINIKYKIETFILFYCILYNIPLLYSFGLFIPSH